MVNGINCGGCKKAADVSCVSCPATSIDITTKKDSGVHPNKVAVVGTVDAEQKRRWQSWTLAAASTSSKEDAQVHAHGIRPRGDAHATTCGLARVSLMVNGINCGDVEAVNPSCASGSA